MQTRVDLNNWEQRAAVYNTLPGRSTAFQRTPKSLETRWAGRVRRIASQGPGQS